MHTPQKKKKKDEILSKNNYPITALETERIKEAIERSDIEKFHLFTRMVRIHFMLKNAVIIKK